MFFNRVAEVIQISVKLHGVYWHLTSWKQVLVGNVSVILRYNYKITCGLVHEIIKHKLMYLVKMGKNI